MNKSKKKKKVCVFVGARVGAKLGKEVSANHLRLPLLLYIKRQTHREPESNYFFFPTQTARSPLKS